MTRFNLVDEAWIPCLMENGKPEMHSIRSVFTEAHRVIEIASQSPLEVASIHRLLLAILERSLDLAGSRDIEAIWEQRKWDNAKLQGYLDKWHARFDLLDPTRPFYQTPGFQEGDPNTVHKLFMDYSTGNNTILFDHRQDDDVGGMDPAHIARALLTIQSYGLGGGRSTTVNFHHAPMVGKALVLLRGNDLFETLSLNLVPIRQSSPLSLSGEASKTELAEDVPSWEWTEPQEPGITRPLRGYFDLLTWQSRIVNLVPSDDGTASLRSMFYAQGGIIEQKVMIDPMVAYYHHEKRGILPVNLDVNRDAWRSYPALVFGTDLKHPPRTILQVAQFVGDSMLSGDRILRIDVFGIHVDKAKAARLLAWRQSRMPLPTACLINEEQRALIFDSVNIAGEFERCLKESLKVLATELVRRNSEAKVNHSAVDQTMSTFNCIPIFWSKLELPFFSLVEELASHSDDQMAGKAVLGWAELIVSMAAKDALEATLFNMGTDARSYKACVLARNTYFWAQGKKLAEMRGRFNV